MTQTKKSNEVSFKDVNFEKAARGKAGIAAYKESKGSNTPIKSLQEYHSNIGR